ncbi:MAG TPA: hypothetical protein VFE30_10655 [Anaeromyxobacteraceae bacterium]|jgi:hypothetical protein|nr:hypothetical protein [Anaeromyxobacteraceae bacterium]
MKTAQAAALSLVAVAGALLVPNSAHAIPAFARKYGTSCATCHTVYPKLTPFGEAFRRNGYRFPGIDSDYVKQETVVLGQEANKKTFPNSIWPGTLPSSVPIAVGFNGQTLVSPDKTSSVARGRNGAVFNLDDLVAEGHLWGGASLSDTVTVWAELTFSDTVSVEHAQVLFNDLAGPNHYFNLVVGKGFPTLSSFGPHSSYLADIGIPNAPVTGIYGTSPDPFVLVDNYKGLELNGVIEGRVNYAVGVNSGKNSFGSSFATEDFYASAGFKLGGMRLDGEGAIGPQDPLRPWAENALTVHGFVYHSNERFSTPGTTAGTAASNDVGLTIGGGARAQLGSLELNLGFYDQSHNRGTDALGNVTADVLYGEATYVLFPWMVPGLRVESMWLKPEGGTRVNDVHLMPGIAFLVRTNLKLILAGNIEVSNGFPQDSGGNPLAWQGGSGDWGALVLTPKPGVAPTSGTQEFESVSLFLAWAM